MLRQLQAQLNGCRLPVTLSQQPASPADSRAAAVPCKWPGDVASAHTARLNLPSTTSSASASQCSLQDHLLPHSRRALLLAVGLSPVLGAGVLSAAHAESLDGRSALTAAAEAEISSDGIGGQVESDTSKQGTSAEQQGSSTTAGDARPAVDQSKDEEPDDRPRQSLDNDEDDSSSSSSSDSDSESDSSSSSDDEEPGELYANDDNAAGGSSNSNNDSSGDSSNSNSSSSTEGSSAPDVPAESDPSTSRAATDATSSSSSNGSKRTAMSANLSVPSYVQILQDSRRTSWPLLAQKIQAREWIELSQLLVQPPFDAVRQACFYIPWALLQSDDFVAAVAARRAYVDYIDHVHALAAIALKAADGVPGADVQVQQAFTLMNASLNAFLSAVPVKYQRYRI